MTAAPPVPHAVPEGLNGAPSHLAHNLPRYQAIAMNPNPPSHPPMPPPDQMVQNHHYRHYAPPPLHDPHAGPPPPPPAPALTSLDQIEARLRQLEHEEMNRMAARHHLLAVRKREDEEFRRMTESAEAEEEVCHCILSSAQSGCMGGTNTDRTLIGPSPTTQEDQEGINGSRT